MAATANGSGEAPSAGERRLRSRRWFDDPHDPGMTALYIERYMNFGLTREELQWRQADHRHRPDRLRSRRPATAITSSSRERVRDGIRDAGGIPLEFPVHPIQETGKRPDRGARPQPRLSRPGRGAARLSDRRRGAHHRLRQDHARLPDGRGDGEHPGDRAFRRADAGRLVAGQARRLGHDHLGGAQAARRGQDRLRPSSSRWSSSSAPSVGHCNTMGTASSMNSLAEALGMSLPGCAMIPAPVPRARLDGLRDRASASSAWCTRICAPPTS